MREILTETNELQIGDRGCVPNLRGASVVGRDGKGHCTRHIRLPKVDQI